MTVTTARPASPNESVSKAESHGTKTKLATLVVTLLAVLLLAAWGLTRVLASPLEATMPTSSEIELEWGVQFTEVSVSADGGLVDLRFVVLDPDSAASMMSEQETAPHIVIDSGGEVTLLPALMPMHHELVAGRTYFLLFRNTDGIVDAGSQLSIAVADERLDGVVAG